MTHGPGQTVGKHRAEGKPSPSWPALTIWPPRSNGLPLPLQGQEAKVSTVGQVPWWMQIPPEWMGCQGPWGPGHGAMGLCRPLTLGPAAPR